MTCRRSSNSTNLVSWSETVRVPGGTSAFHAAGDHNGASRPYLRVRKFSGAGGVNGGFCASVAGMQPTGTNARVSYVRVGRSPSTVFAATCREDNHMQLKLLDMRVISKQMMLQIADDYERLAKRAERPNANPSKPGRPSGPRSRSQRSYSPRD